MVRWLGLSSIGENGGQPRAGPIRIVTLGIIVLVAVGLVFSAPVAADQAGSNLLTNPGCDADSGGSPPDGWTLVSTNVQCTNPEAVGGPPAPDGSDAFTDYSGDGSDAIVEQEVDVTGRTEYTLGGEIGTSDSVDYARIEVEYLDGDGTGLDDGSVTREVKPATDAWETFADSSVAPPEATSAVVRITLVDNSGTSYSGAHVNYLSFEAGPYAGGDGSGTTPYEIANWHQLDNVRDNLGAEFVLIADLDETTDGYDEVASSSANGGDGFEPIGVGDSPSTIFEGVFDGDGHVISDLYIDRPDNSNVGLFGSIGDTGAVRHVGVPNVSLNGSSTTGGLAGTNDGTVDRSYATGTVVGGNQLGGLVGENRGTVTQSYATVTVTGSNNVGGLVGFSEGTVSRSYATGTVDGNSQMGGLVGNSDGTVEQSYATGTVDEADTADFTGGLLGISFGSVDDSYWNVDSTGQDSSDGADEIGLTTDQMTGMDAESNMFDFGNTWAVVDEFEDGDRVVSYPYLVDNSQEPAPGRQSSEMYAGGNGIDGDPYEIETWDHLDNVRLNPDSHYELIGDLGPETAGYRTHVADPSGGFEPIGDTPIGGTAFTGSFDGGGHEIADLRIDRSRKYVGLFGWSEGPVTNVTLTNVSVAGSEAVGGLVGNSEGAPVTESTVSGTINGSDYFVGGVVGFTNGPISNVSANVSVTATAPFVGGVVGSGVSVSNSSVSGVVDSTGNYVGGLIGSTTGGATITDSVVTANVTGDRRVGGLVGRNSGTVRTSFAAGTVTGSETGGVIGQNLGSVTDSYWDLNTTTQTVGIGDSTDSGVTGLTTHQMQRFAPRLSMPALFDGSGTWTLTEGYPALGWQNRPEPTVDALAAADVSTRPGVAGTITVTATTGGTPVGEGATVAVVDNGSLAGLSTGSTAVTDENGTASFDYQASDVGEYEVVFAWQDDTTDTAAVTILDVTNPTADAGADRTVTEDSALTVDGSGSTDNVGVVSYEWAFGDGSTATGETPSHTYADPGDYTVWLTVTDAAGNTDIDTSNVTVLDVTNPTADAGSDRTVDEDMSIDFDGSGSTDNDAIASYAWDFDDGNTTTGESPSHTYANPGTYAVELTVTDDAGNTDTDTATVTVTDVTDPTADAGSDRTVDEDTALTFDGSGSTDNDAIVSYEWDFGDGNTATGKTPSHTYADPDGYFVTLTVTDNAGNTDTNTATVTVLDVTNPTADAGTDRTVDEDISVDFDGSGSTDNGEITSYVWEFGDGTTATGKTPGHIYTDPGDYIVELTVTDVAGNNDTDSAILSVRDVTDPTADAGPDRTVDEDVSIGFDGSSSTDNDAISSYEWAFGDGTTTTGETPSHTYTDPGDYSVELTVIDTAGNTDTDSATVTVTDVTNPTADAGRDRTADEDTSLTFDGSGSTDNDAIASYEWAFGDGNSLTGLPPSHTYADPGDYTVELTVTDDAGNTDSDTATVTVTDVTDPTADAGSDRTVDEDISVDFDGSGSTDNGGIAAYAWEFNDRTTATGKTPSHTYSDFGDYTVRLTVTDDAGNTDTDTASVTVKDVTNPTANASNSDTAGVVGDPIGFNGTASTDNDEITSYEWDFDDGTTNTGDTVLHSFVDTGPYAVELRVIDGNGNTDTDTVTVTVRPAAVDTLSARTVTETAGISGSLTVNASDAFGNSLGDEEIIVTDTGGLGGLMAGEANRTNESGDTTFEFVEHTSGTYTVGFEAANDSTVNTTATITVEPAAVDSLSVSLAEDSLTTGESTTLTVNATFINGTTLDRTETTNLTSNDSSVASVDANGNVRAEGAGRTDLKAELAGINETVAVLVSNPPSNNPPSSSSSSTSSRSDDDVEIQTNEDGSVTASLGASADESTSVDLGNSVSDDESGTRYSRVDLTFGEDTDVSFEARPTSRNDLPEGTSSLSGGGSGDGGTGDTSDSDRAISYVEFTVSSDGVDASDRVSSATIEFSMGTDTLVDRGLDADEVALHRYNDEANEWDELDTEVVSEGDSEVTYESTTPGFSMFAVGERADEMGTEPTNDSIEPTESTDDPTEPIETNDDTPGFGLLLGLVSLLTLSVLVGRFQRTD